MKLSIPDSKRKKAIAKIEEQLADAKLSKVRQLPSRQLASSVIGTLTHLAWISPGAAAWLRSGWQATAAASAGRRWDHSGTIPWALQQSVISDEIVEDLEWWITHLLSDPTRRLWTDCCAPDELKESPCPPVGWDRAFSALLPR